MSRGGGGRRLRAAVVVAIAAGVLGLGAAALAVPAGAATRGHTSSAAAVPVCQRAHNQWARLVTANQKTKAAFDRARALQVRLLRADRAATAHRLDARIAYLQQLHTTLVARVNAIAARVQGRCDERPPDLVSF